MAWFLQLGFPLYNGAGFWVVGCGLWCMGKTPPNATTRPWSNDLFFIGIPYMVKTTISHGAYNGSII
jgi:hypothetical protein